MTRMIRLEKHAARPGDPPGLQFDEVISDSQDSEGVESGHADYPNPQPFSLPSHSTGQHSSPVHEPSLR